MQWYMCNWNDAKTTAAAESTAASSSNAIEKTFATHTHKLCKALYYIFMEYGKCEICAITWNCIRLTMLHIFFFRCCCKCALCWLFTFYDQHLISPATEAGEQEKKMKKNELTRLILCICTVCVCVYSVSMQSII